MIETASFDAPVFDFTLGPEMGSEVELEMVEAARPPLGLAVFLLRLMAYFQGCLASLPRAPKHSITIIDSSLDNSSEPLIQVRMNRHLSRRLRWLIKRGRVERSGEMRLATEVDKARCSLTPGQFNEYMIRVDGVSRIRLYKLGLSRHARRLISITSAGLQGHVLCLGKAALCLAPLMPD